MYLPVAIKEDGTISDFIAEINNENKTVIENQRLIFSHSFLQLDGDRIRNCCDLYINYFKKDLDISDEQYIIEQHLDVGAIHYPIYSMVIEHNDALAFIWKYNTYLFNKEIIEDIVTCYKDVLLYMVSNADSTIRELANSCRIEAIIL
jgi:hypothetical protein